MSNLMKRLVSFGYFFLIERPQRSTLIAGGSQDSTNYLPLPNDPPVKIQIVLFTTSYGYS
jgi:hypothetical protein